LGEIKSYKGVSMALYSWFGRNNNKPSKKSVHANNNLLKAPEPAKYIENYTMWPTAKIKQGIEIALPVYDDVENKLVEESKQQKSTLDRQSIHFEAVIISHK
jgi:hypothetical protein